MEDVAFIAFFVEEKLRTSIFGNTSIYFESHLFCNFIACPLLQNTLEGNDFLRNRSKLKGPNQDQAKDIL